MENKLLIKLLIIGDGCVGKSTYIRRLLTGEFERHYIATNGVVQHKLNYYSNYGKIEFLLCDVASKQECITNECYKDLDGIIIMFDVTSKDSFLNIQKWQKECEKECKNVPIFFCGNKIDIRDRKVTVKDIKMHNILPYCDMSAKSNYNFEEPLLYFSQLCTGNKDLIFVEAPPIVPPNVQIGEDEMDQYLMEEDN